MRIEIAEIKPVARHKQLQYDYVFQAEVSVWKLTKSGNMGQPIGQVRIRYDGGLDFHLYSDMLPECHFPLASTDMDAVKIEIGERFPIAELFEFHASSIDAREDIRASGKWAHWKENTPGAREHNPYAEADKDPLWQRG